MGVIRNSGMSKMKDHKAEDHAVIASRLFQAMCALYPDSYVSNGTAERSAEHPAGAAYGNHSGSSAGSAITAPEGQKARLPAARTVRLK